MPRKPTRPVRIRKTEPVKKEVNISKSFHLDFLNPTQKLAWNAFQNHDLLFLLGPAGTGKTHLSVSFAVKEILANEKKRLIFTRPIVEAGENLGFLPGPQPLSAKILTPNGWTTMGDLKIGDKVIGRDGKPTKVLNIFPKGKKKVYKINTTDGTSTEACEDHLWITKTANELKHNKKGNIRTTKEILSNLSINGKINHFLPRNEPIHFDKKNLPLAPYSMGALLGDGCFSHCTSIACPDEDNEITDRINDELNELNCCLYSNPSTIGHTVKSNCKISKKPAKGIRLTNLENNSYTEYISVATAYKEMNLKKATLKYRCKNNLKINNIKYEFLPLQKRWANPLKNILADLNLLGKKAHDKFIPDIYKYSSLDDRLNLLRGLLDTDGTVNKGKASFSTVSLQLAKDIIELTRSLGGRATLIKRNRNNEKKRFIGNRLIKNSFAYEFNISVPSNLNPFYIKRKAEKFNSKYMHHVGIKSIEPICEKEVQCILIENPEHLYITDEFIVTHNTADEKVNPYMMPIFDTIDKLCGKESYQRDKIKACQEVVPLAFMRGRNFDDAIVILDEAQNCTKEQLILAMTRLGTNSKMIITGDPTQSDLEVPGAFRDIVTKLESVPDIGIIEFNETSIVRHPLLAKILRKLKD